MYGGSPELSLVPTIDELFERARDAAQLGPNGRPHSFEATYVAAEGWCGHNSSGSIGMLSATEACCRYWQPDGTDGVTVEQCERAAGHIGDCSPTELSIGTIHAAGRSCCRPLVRQGS